MEVTMQSGGTLAVADEVFATQYNEALIHQVVTANMAGARAGTRAQRTRAEVSGGGSKPWRQKGTGRARSGTSSSPIWRSGGRAFAAKPQNWSQKVNRKMYRGALRSILSELLRQERLQVVDAFDVSQPKTKGLVAKLKDLELTDVLIVDLEPSDNLRLAARNLYQVGVCSVAELDPVSLIAFDRVLVTTAAMKQIEERLS